MLIGVGRAGTTGTDVEVLELGGWIGVTDQPSLSSVFERDRDDDDSNPFALDPILTACPFPDSKPIPPRPLLLRPKLDLRPRDIDRTEMVAESKFTGI